MIIKELISTKKREGVLHISVIDLYDNTNLPLEQISKIMSQLEGEGIVKERNDE